jgi:tRNA (guanine10-N2)-dimethyltransferase
MERGAFFLLSGEGGGLPQAELRALLDLYPPDRPPVEYGRLVVTGPLATISPILLHTQPLPRQELSWAIEALKQVAGPQRYAVRFHDLVGGEDRRAVEAEAGALVGRVRPDWRVSLNAPSLEIHLLRVAAGYFVGYSPPLPPKGWHQRRPRARPFFHPSALRPKLARALVNLARVQEGEYLLDPFCGTGAILIEAGLIGVRPIGVDLARRMCRGAALNLAHYCVPGDILQADALASPVREFQGVATDIPYGRASSTLGRSETAILEGFISYLADSLPKGRFSVILHSHNTPIPKGPKLMVVEEHTIYTHRSLTRIISVLKRV